MTSKHTVGIDKETQDALDYLSRVLEMPKKKILKLVINELFETAFSVKPCVGAKNILMTVESSITRQDVIISFIGRSKIISNMFMAPSDMTEKEVDEKIKAEVEKAIEAEKQRSES